jgi:hypothetical protein
MPKQRYTKAYVEKVSSFMPDSQPPFQYTDDVLRVFEKYLSPERLASYYALARGNRWVGIQLYERNTELSEALYGVIQGLEITLRNAIHNTMTAALGTPDWYDRFAWDASELAAVQKAKEKIQEKLLSITPGRVIAELTFGFWVKLTALPYEKSLWFKYLHQIAPKVRRKALHGRLVQFKTLRNRIAHHERIVGRTRDLPTECRDVLEVIGWLNSDMQAWVQHKNCFTERYGKPLKRNRILASDATNPSPENGDSGSISG